MVVAVAGVFVFLCCLRRILIRHKRLLTIEQKGMLKLKGKAQDIRKEVQGIKNQQGDH